MKSLIRVALSILATAAVACSDDSGDDGGGAGMVGVPAVPGGDMGTPGGDMGTPGGDMGTPGGDMGTPGGDMGTPGGDMGGDPNSWTTIHTDILINSCSGPVCHSGSAGELTLSDKAAAYAALVNVPAMAMNILGETNPTSCVDTGTMRVVPGDPDASLLYAKVRTDMEVPCGNRMPTGGMLSPEQQEQIRAWIAAGALDN